MHTLFSFQPSLQRHVGHFLATYTTAVTAHAETSTARIAANASYIVTLIAHTSDEISHAAATISQAVTAKEHITAATAHMHPFEPTTNALEKGKHPFQQILMCLDILIIVKIA